MTNTTTHTATTSDGTAITFETTRKNITHIIAINCITADWAGGDGTTRAWGIHSMTSNKNTAFRTAEKLRANAAFADDIIETIETTNA